MWKNIKEELPEKEASYLVALKIGKAFDIAVLDYSISSGTWTDRDCENWASLVTHWDNLPELPHNRK